MRGESVCRKCGTGVMWGGSKEEATVERDVSPSRISRVTGFLERLGLLGMQALSLVYHGSRGEEPPLLQNQGEENTHMVEEQGTTDVTERTRVRARRIILEEEYE
jgi:hypothetical protein